MLQHQKAIDGNGFTIIDDVYTANEVENMISVIKLADQSNLTFRKTLDLFAIRQFLQEVPGVKQLLFNNKLKNIIGGLFGDDFFVVKSIYFDKPEKSNWFVAWHQDLTIGVDKKTDISGFSSWTNKLNNFAVQPPLEILQNNFTVRIHLDNTDQFNGALKVIPGSHKNNIYRAENIDLVKETETFCNVNAGGIMIMRPLLMHASDRSSTSKRRRVIHVEFSKADLPAEINWAEKEFY